MDIPSDSFINGIYILILKVVKFLINNYCYSISKFLLSSEYKNDDNSLTEQGEALSLKIRSNLYKLLWNFYITLFSLFIYLSCFRAYSNILIRRTRSFFKFSCPFRSPCRNAIRACVQIHHKRKIIK